MRAGDDRGVITPYLYNCLVQALDDCERIFGNPALPGEAMKARVYYEADDT